MTDVLFAALAPFGVLLIAAAPAHAAPYATLTAEEKQFVAHLKAIGITPRQGFTDDDIIDSGWNICRSFREGKTRDYLAQKIYETADRAEGPNRAKARQVVDLAIKDLCSAGKPAPPTGVIM